MGYDDELARAAWRALQGAASADEQLQGMLAQLALSPDEGERKLREWLSQLADREGRQRSLRRMSPEVTSSGWSMSPVLRPFS